MPRRQPSPEPGDPSITLAEDEGREFKKRRESLDLSTRALAKLAKTSNATITNIENGIQRTAKRSLYVALVRVLYKSSKVEAEERADEVIARNDAAIKRLARALSGLTTEQIEAAAVGIESIARKPGGG